MRTNSRGKEQSELKRDAESITNIFQRLIHLKKRVVMMCVCVQAFAIKSYFVKSHNPPCEHKTTR